MNRDHRRSSHPPTVTSSPGVCLREDSPYLQTTTTTFLSTTTTSTAITKPQSPQPPRFSQKLFQLSNSSLKPLFYPSRTHTRTHTCPVVVGRYFLNLIHARACPSVLERGRKAGSAALLLCEEGMESKEEERVRGGSREEGDGRSGSLGSGRERVLSS